MKIKLALVLGLLCLPGCRLQLHSETADPDSFIGPLIPTPAGQPSGTVELQPTRERHQPLQKDSEQEEQAGACRFGFGVADPADPNTWGTRIGVCWYLNWGIEGAVSTETLEYWRVVRVAETGVYPDPERIVELAAQHPGEFWIVGNEPDVIWQDNTTPERFAHHYHAVYAAIKGADPTARVMVGAIAQVTTLRLAYLDRFLAAYQREFGESLPAEGWTFHTYVLPEIRDDWGIGIPPGFEIERGDVVEVEDHGRLDLFETQIVRFREWMALHGYRELPLVLTEFGILMFPDHGYPEETVIEYLRSSLDLLNSLKDPEIGMPSDEGRLVQRWAWFSLSYQEVYPSGNLADLEHGELTALGQAYREYILNAQGGN